MELDRNLLNSFLGKKENPKEKKSDATESKLGRYKRLMEAQTIIPGISFTQGGKKEGLWFYDGKIKIFAPLTELLPPSLAASEFSYVFLDQLNRTYSVIVTDVNEETQTVTVSANKAQDIVRPQIIKEIDSELKKGNQPLIEAIVRFLPTDKITEMSTVLYADIFGLGISGKLKNREWADCFLPDLKTVTRPGVIFEAVITGKENKPYRDGVVYNISRRQARPSAWDSIDSFLKVDQMVKVECLTPMQSYFVGKLDGIQDFTCSCVYPRSFTVVPGGVYSGFVTKINKDKKRVYVDISRQSENI